MHLEPTPWKRNFLISPTAALVALVGLHGAGAALDPLGILRAPQRVPERRERALN